MTTRLDPEASGGGGTERAGLARRRRRAAALGAVLLASTAVAGCATRGLAFRTDDRVDIVSPKEDEVVEPPFTVEWTAREYDGAFAVVVDRAPQPPGKPLSWFARGDETCEATPGCPDAEYLAQRGVYATDEHSVVIDRVDVDSSTRNRCVEHEATVVLLDEDGRRRGESSWAVPFRVCRPG